MLGGNTIHKTICDSINDLAILSYKGIYTVYEELF